MTAVLRLSPPTRAERFALSFAHALESIVERRQRARTLPRTRLVRAARTTAHSMEQTTLTAMRLGIRR